MKDNTFIRLTDIADVISGYAFDSKWFNEGTKKIISAWPRKQKI